MTNEEKYKTPKERNKAFHRFCKSINDCSVCPLGKVPKLRCPFSWLALEAEDDNLLPCPFCGGEAMAVQERDGFSGRCKLCWSGTDVCNTEAEAIAAWNRRAK